MAFIELKADVSKKEGGQFKKVGDMVYYVPTLEDAGFTPERQKDDKGEDLFDEGLPVYKEAAANWVMGAVHAAVKAQARNKLLPGTASLREGAKIATDWDTLTAEAERPGGEALKAMHEVKDLFKKHVASLGKSQKAQDTLITLFSNPPSLALQSAENREKMSNYVGEFLETLNPEQATRYSRYLDKIATACATEAEADDF